MTGVISRTTPQFLVWIGSVVAAVALTIAPAPATAEPPSKRVVGGAPANPADWPSIAALMEGGTGASDQFCGATVIAPRAALTAAHCVQHGPNPSVSIVVGRPDLRVPTGVVIDVARAWIHPRRVHTWHHDLAVLKLDAKAPGPYADLPTAKQARRATAVGEKARVAGWGSTVPNGSSSSPILMEAQTRVIHHQACTGAFPGFHHGSAICTRGRPIQDKNGDTSACYGDSGGPLVADTAKGALLVGVVSYGAVRCGVKRPTVYGRVAAGLGFIRDKAGLR